MNEKQVKADRFLPIPSKMLKGKSFYISKLIDFKACNTTFEHQSGYGMLMALLFVSFIAGLTTLAIDFERIRTEKTQASAAAWHLSTLSKAARIYVRNNSFPLDVADTDGDGLPDDNNGDGVVDNRFSLAVLLGVGSNVLEFSIADLNNAELLPPNFSITNIWGQNARMFAAPYPMVAGTVISIGGSVSTGPTPQQPAAYVFLDEGPNPSQLRMKSLALAAREFDSDINAPIFDESGTNITGDCDGDGEDDLVNWDIANSNCLDISDYNRFGLAAFQPGALMVPAWRMVAHDSRAMLRFSQPGNPIANTMMTDLRFGEEITDASGNCTDFIDLGIPNATGTAFNTVSSSLCNVTPEQANLAPHAITVDNIIQRDQQTDIRNIGTFDVRQLVLTDQALENPTVAVQEIEYDYAAGTFTGETNATSVAGSPVNEVLTVAGRPPSGADPGSSGDTIVGGPMRLTNELGNPHVNPADYIPTLSFRSVLPDGTNAAFVNELSVDHTLTVVSRDGSNSSLQVNNLAEVGQAFIAADTVTNDMIVDVSNPNNFYGSNNANITNVLVDSTNTNFNEGVLATNIDASGINSLTLPLLDVVNTMSTSEGLVVTGASPIAGYSLITDQAVAAAELIVNGTLNVSSELYSGGNAIIDGPTRMQFCAAGGRCPDISEEPPACAGVTC